MKTVTFTPMSLRDWRKLPDEVRRRMQRRLGVFADTGAGDVKKLQGRDGFRLRVGDWRVIFLVEPDLIIVTAVGHRRDIYE